MLGTRNAVASLAVKDLDRARDFYTATLGLSETGEADEEMFMLKSGNSTFNVYRSEYAGTNEATAMTWEVDDIAAEVAELKRKGIAFEHYDMPGMRAEGDLHVADDGYKVAWFKDPDGNILNLVGAV